jgi:hypothetical protein
MDLYAKLLAFSFVTYLSTIAVHFITLSHEQDAASSGSSANPWHQHELAAGTPAHALLKHSHARWDPSELLGGGDLGGGAMWAAQLSSMAVEPPYPHHAERTHEVAEEEVTEVASAPHDAADAKHATLACDVSGDGSEQGLVYWHSAASSNAAADDDWVSPWKGVL